MYYLCEPKRGRVYLYGQLKRWERHICTVGGEGGRGGGNGEVNGRNLPCGEGGGPFPLWGGVEPVLGEEEGK